MLDFKEWLLTEVANRKFSCVMASIDDKSIVQWTRNHIDKKDLYEPEGGIEKESHVTILYGLHTNNPDDIKPISQNIKPFEIKLGKISKFEAPEYDVLKIEVISSNLHRFNKKLKELEYTSKYKEYIPHCTLAYIKKGSCSELLWSKNFQNKKFLQMS